MAHVPAVGDEVLFHADDRWVPAEVTVTRPDGRLTLFWDEGELIASHGAHISGWMTYDEAVEYHKAHAPA